MKIEERRERKEKIKETQRKLKDYENKRKFFNIVFLMFCSFFLTLTFQKVQHFPRSFTITLLRAAHSRFAFRSGRFSDGPWRHHSSRPTWMQHSHCWGWSMATVEPVLHSHARTHAHTYLQSLPGCQSTGADMNRGTTTSDWQTHTPRYQGDRPGAS